ncbi:MAG TPA: cbb3-type cytochrome oxidase assembly protein [Bacteroidota bacterium]|nr:cbb3-type cytochrome oxidase assembly protein [Bacteroidota bacterium]
MMISVYFLIFMSLGLGGLFAAVFVWAAKHNQFKDIEEPKYQMMRDDDGGVNG